MGNSNPKKERNFSDYYISGARIGTGTFATVRRCMRKSDMKPFAVKIIDKKQLTAKELIGLKDEIKILQLMEHPYIIKIYDVFTCDSNEKSSATHTKIKMILELCEKGDLLNKIKHCPNHRLNEPEAALITFNIARAINYLHDHAVVHRDLKPENILFTQQGILKLTDFGLAHYIKSLSSDDSHIMRTCCGTPHYVAPEVLMSDEYSIEVDYWSLGVILYIMLSGCQPFNAHSIQRMYEKIIRGQYYFVSPYWDNVSDIAKDCVKQLMCVDPRQRLNCDRLMKHPFIVTNVEVDELLRQEQELMAMTHPTKFVRSVSLRNLASKTNDVKMSLNRFTKKISHKRPNEALHKPIYDEQKETEEEAEKEKVKLM